MELDASTMVEGDISMLMDEEQQRLFRLTAHYPQTFVHGCFEIMYSGQNEISAITITSQDSGFYSEDRTTYYLCVDGVKVEGIEPLNIMDLPICETNN